MLRKNFLESHPKNCIPEGSSRDCPESDPPIQTGPICIRRAGTISGAHASDPAGFSAAQRTPNSSFLLCRSLILFKREGANKTYCICIVIKADYTHRGIYLSGYVALGSEQMCDKGANLTHVQCL